MDYASSNPQSRTTSRSITPVPPLSVHESEIDVYQNGLNKRQSDKRARPERIMLEEPGSKSPSPGPPEQRTDLLQEIVEHQDDPMYFSEEKEALSSEPGSSMSDSLLDLEASEDEQLERTSRHPRRRANWTESAVGLGFGFNSEPTRTPSLPPPPIRASTPEVQRAQSYFTPSSLVASSFPTRWVSSLLSRPAQPPAQPARSPESEVPVVIAHSRASTITGSSSITHGTPFAAHPYQPPSGAPGFTGDRSWDKGFQFDKENIERTSIRLLGRKEATIGVLSVSVADKVCSSLVQHPPACRC